MLPEQLIPNNTLEYKQQIAVGADTLVAKFKAVCKEFTVPNVCIILGSGLNEFPKNDKLFKVEGRISFTEVPNMPKPAVAGHAGEFIYGTTIHPDDESKNSKVLLIGGRLHYYEGYPMYQLGFATRIVGAMGIQVLLASNAAGGAVKGVPKGYAIAITDHVNMTRRNALEDVLGDPFYAPGDISVDNCYSERIRKIVVDEARHVRGPGGPEDKLKMFEGVYGWTCGPSYETPAEVRAGMGNGIIAFGMSTVPEAIAAKVEGLEFFAISVITNEAAGLSAELLDHSDVSLVAKTMGPKFEELICRVVPRICNPPQATHTRAANVSVPVVIDPIIAHKWTEADVEVMVQNLKQKVPAGINTAVWGQTKFVSHLAGTEFSYKVPSPVFSPSITITADAVVFSVDRIDTQSVIFWTGVLSGIGITRIVFALSCASLGVKVDDIVRIGPMYVHDLAAIPAFGAPSVTNESHPKECVKAFAVPPPTVPTAAEVQMAVNIGCSVSFAYNAAPMLCSKCMGIDTVVIGAVESVAPSAKVTKAVDLKNAISQAIVKPSPHDIVFHKMPNYDAQRAYHVREDLAKPRAFAQAAVSAVQDVAKRYFGLKLGEIGILANNVFQNDLAKIGELLFTVPYSSLPHLSDISAAAGVPSAISWYRVGNKVVPVAGMFESWYGLRVEDSSFIMRVFAFMGLKKVIFISHGFGNTQSDVVIVRDHINLSGVNSLGGKNNFSDGGVIGKRFPDMTKSYNNKLRTQFKTVLPNAPEAVCVFDFISGNSLHIKDKVADLQSFGADVFCPSIAQEALIARHHLVTVAALIAVRPTTCAPVSAETCTKIVNAVRSVINMEHDLEDPELIQEEARKLNERAAMNV